MALDKQRTGDILASFFAYALGQVPPDGWLTASTRRMLVAYITLWCFAGVTGFMTGLSPVIVRCACGLAKAGAYPSSGLPISRWFPFHQRARE